MRRWRVVGVLTLGAIAAGAGCATAEALPPDGMFGYEAGIGGASGGGGATPPIQSGGSPGSGGDMGSGGAPSGGASPTCVACTAPANGAVLCTAGTCDFTCSTGYTKTGPSCVANPICTDKVKNSSETDVDCGGGSCPKCAPGLACASGSDCALGPCEADGKCGCTAKTCESASSCAAAVDDGCGKKLDCSTSCKDPAVCYQEKCCKAATTCPATACSAKFSPGCGLTVDCSMNCPSTDVCFSEKCCTPKVCTMCGHPSDGCAKVLDCGICADGASCQANADCASKFCDGGKCVTCTDGKMNHGETDVDCGGPNCPKCTTMKKCTAATDCDSNVCCNLFTACLLRPNTCQ